MEKAQSNPILGTTQNTQAILAYLDARIKQEEEALAALSTEESSNSSTSEEELDNNDTDSDADPAAQQELEDSNEHFREHPQYFGSLIEKEALKKRTELCRQRKSSCNTSNNADPSEQSNITENYSFLKHLNFERCCLAFVGIVIMLKMFFNYYIDTEEEEN